MPDPQVPQAELRAAYKQRALEAQLDSGTVPRRREVEQLPVSRHVARKVAVFFVTIVSERPIVTVGPPF